MSESGRALPEAYDPTRARARISLRDRAQRWVSVRMADMSGGIFPLDPRSRHGVRPAGLTPTDRLSPRELRRALGEEGVEALLEVGAAVAERDQVLILDAGELLAHAPHHLLAGAHGEGRLGGDLLRQGLGPLHQGLGRVEQLVDEADGQRLLGLD